MNSEITEAQLLANRSNARKSTGPRNTNSTRFNALKHGLLAQGVTELDDPQGFASLVSQLEVEHAPATLVERELVQQLAICILRSRRARLIEAEEFTAQLNPPETKVTLTEMGQMLHDTGTTKVETIDPGLTARLKLDGIERIVSTVLRYLREPGAWRFWTQFGTRPKDSDPRPASIRANGNRPLPPDRSFG
jgi:hypothetical protein